MDKQLTAVQCCNLCELGLADGMYFDKARLGKQRKWEYIGNGLFSRVGLTMNLQQFVKRSIFTPSKE